MLSDAPAVVNVQVGDAGALPLPFFAITYQAYAVLPANAAPGV